MRIRKREALKHADGRVLHVGCIGEYLWLDELDHNIWIHGDLVDQQGEENVVGIDYYKEGVDYLQDEGYDIRYENAEEFDLGETFDTILMPQMLHHLSNPGKAIRCCKNHLIDDGKIVISHPNHFFLERQLMRAVNLGAMGDGEEKLESYKEYTGHTAMHHPEHLYELFGREGFEPVKGYYVPSGASPSSWKGALWHWMLIPTLDKVFPDIFTKKTFVSVFKE